MMNNDSLLNDYFVVMAVSVTVLGESPGVKKLQLIAVGQREQKKYIWVCPCWCTPTIFVVSICKTTILGGWSGGTTIYGQLHIPTNQSLSVEPS